MVDVGSYDSGPLGICSSTMIIWPDPSYSIHNLQPHQRCDITHSIYWPAISGCYFKSLRCHSERNRPLLSLHTNNTSMAKHHLTQCRTPDWIVSNVQWETPKQVLHKSWTELKLLVWLVWTVEKADLVPEVPAFQSLCWSLHNIGCLKKQKQMPCCQVCHFLLRKVVSSKIEWWLQIK